MGYKDANDKFIAAASLVFNNIVIYKKGEGDNFNSENGFSSTYLLDRFTGGLNKYGMWEPDRNVINEFSIDGKVYFKVNLEDKISISSPAPAFNGTTILHILENGDLLW